MNLNDTCMGLTHRGLVTPFGDIDRCQHLLRQWLDAWQHQGIVWTNADYHLWSSSGTHLREILQRVVRLLFCVISLKYILLKLPPLLSGANESIWYWGKNSTIRIWFVTHLLWDPLTHTSICEQENGLAPYKCQPLSMLIKCYDPLNPYEKISVEYKSHFNKKYLWKCLQNWPY